MSVHVGEIHTEVIPVASAAAAAQVDTTVIAVAAEAAQRKAWLAARVAAEDFDD